jgi:hypothetical protein
MQASGFLYPSRRHAMSSAHPPLAVEPVEVPRVREVRVYSHSPLFYWWPVWAVGYILALVTYL